MDGFRYTVDTSAYRKKVKKLLDEGNYLYNKGTSVEKKEEGLNLIMQSLQQMKLWMEVEQDQTVKTTISTQYKQIYADIGTKLDYLESVKKGKNKVLLNDGSNTRRGGNDDKGDDEDDKLKNSLNDAIVSTKPNVKWEDIAGLENAKAMLKDAVILPIKFPQIFQGALKPWKGILMYGPPGTGKTFMAKACATEASGTFFSVSSSDLISKYVGESEKLIKTLFNMAREKKPSIIFIDEVDSLCGARGDGQNETSKRVLTEFLVQMQGVGHDDTGVLVLGATNLPWGLDSAIRRRFEKKVYIPLPDHTGRIYMIKMCLSKTPNSLTEPQIEQLTQDTEGYSGADISILVRDAAYQPVRLMQNTPWFSKTQEGGKTYFTPVEESERGRHPQVVKMHINDIQSDQLRLPPLTYADFQSALKRTKPSVNQDQLKQFEDWTTEFGQEG